MNNLTWKYEDLCKDRGIEIVCGVDEAGRGPLAGRVYAAAVVLEKNADTEELASRLDDSKKLTPKKREMLEAEIKDKALAWCVAFSEVEEIEKLNILEASLLAMRRAIEGLSEENGFVSEGHALSEKVRFALIDGNVDRDFDKIGVRAKCIVGGDGISPSIAAASILAKTARDSYCLKVMHAEYPKYGFDRHKGYGTASHYKAVDEYGLCRFHRRSFFNKYFEKKSKAVECGNETEESLESK